MLNRRAFLLGSAAAVALSSTLAGRAAGQTPPPAVRQLSIRGLSAPIEIVDDPYGVLGTREALKLYREYLAAQGMGMVTLEPERQEEFMSLLYRIKGGERGPDVRSGMAALTADLAAGGAEAIILGCAGLAGHAAAAEDAAGVPVVEPCRAAGAMALLAALGGGEGATAAG